MTLATPLFQKVRPRRSSEQIAIQIRDLFLSGSKLAGEKLLDDERMAEELGVTRGTVRNALRALEVAGMIELRAGRNGGAFIAQGKPRVLSDNMVVLMRLHGVTIRQLTEARLLIGEVVARAACARASNADLEALDANIKEAQELYARRRMTEKAVANIEFHNILARATRNPFLEIVMSTLTEAMTAFVRETAVDAGSATFASRRRFMAAMRARDEDAAVAEMTKYLRRVNKLHESVAAKRAGGADEAARVAPDDSPKMFSRLLQGKTASAPSPRSSGSSRPRRARP